MIAPSPLAYLVLRLLSFDQAETKEADEYWNTPNGTCPSAMRAAAAVAVASYPAPSSFVDAPTSGFDISIRAVP